MKMVRSYISEGHKINVYEVGDNILEVLADDPQEEQRVLARQLARLGAQPDKYSFPVGLDNEDNSVQ